MRQTKINKHNKRNKDKKHKKTKKHYYKLGGTIESSKIFENMLSIGFEIETTDLVKLTLTKDETTNKTILVNSSLTNIDLEYGFADPNEYTYIKDEKEESFKITNDSAEDSEFNELIENYYNDEDEDENTKIILKIPPNPHLSQQTYEILFREPSEELLNFSSFTDTEYIATYYNPNKNTDIIKTYFFKSIRELSNHLKQLVTIKNSSMIVLDDDKQIKIPNLLNQTYVLPNTSLVYFNSSLYKISNYNINEDLKFVVQCTFSCNILYCYRIMLQLLTITNSNTYYKQLINYSNLNKNEKIIKNSKELLEKINNIKNYLSYDEYALTKTMNITNLLVDNYNNKFPNFPLNKSDNLVKEIRTYLFLIIYKVFIYINSYIENINMEGNMLKKHLSFAVRHNNYVLFLELKKLIDSYISTSNNKNENININTSTIINELLDEKILSKVYDTAKAKNEHQRALINSKGSSENLNKYDGDPIFSINSYFNYFDKNNDDWLVVNNIDEKSTKFDLTNNVIIIEFRDFPVYSYLELFSMGDNNIKKQILQNNVGTLSMKTLNYFLNKYAPTS